MSEALPTPVPEVTSETAAFWAATAEGTLLLPRCERCDTVIWYPRAFCPGVREPRRHVVRGERTRVRLQLHDHPAAARRRTTGRRPIVVAYVELEEGPRVLTNIVDCELDEVEIGMPVEVVFHDTGEGRALYRFRPARS